MPRTLRRGDTGDDVRTLQANLLRMLRGRVQFSTDGVFGPKTEEAVRLLERQLHLHLDSGIAGPEVQRALATRVIEIKGSMGRNLTNAGSQNRNPRSPVTPAVASPHQPTPQPQAPASTGGWLLQGQPATMYTPPPFYFYDPQHGPPPGHIVSGGLSLGLVYRTASEGPHWEIGLPGPGFVVNTRSAAGDPRYTLQVQSGVTYADPFARGRFHTAVFGQVASLVNLDPDSVALQAAVGGQISVDIINDSLNVFLQGNLAGQWNLTNGQFQFGSGFVLGCTLQWEPRFSRH